MQEDMNVVSAQNITVAFQNSEVLQDITFDIGSGDYVGIVGPNGSGKSTLVKALLGIIPFKFGTVKLFGSDLGAFGDWHRIGYLPQKLRMPDPHFPANVHEIVSCGLLSRKKRLFKFLGAADKAKVDHVLELLGISELKERMIGRLSGGQQQRVLLARALVNDPELLLLDEPTVALDPQIRESFYETLEKLNRERKITILLVTHDSGSIGKYATKFLYLDKKIVFFGTFDEFCHSPEMTRYFGGESQHIICGRH